MSRKNIDFMEKAIKIDFFPKNHTFLKFFTILFQQESLSMYRLDA